jgi:hypothetical protein
LGNKLKNIYGKLAFIEKNHFIISNVERCIKSFKFFLLGVLSNEPSINILSDFWSEEEILENNKNQAILNHLNVILQQFNNKKIKERKQGNNNPSVILHCNEKEIIEHCKKIGLDTNSFSMELHKRKENEIFHPIKKLE